MSLTHYQRTTELRWSTTWIPIGMEKPIEDGPLLVAVSDDQGDRCVVMDAQSVRDGGCCVTHWAEISLPNDFCVVECPKCRSMLTRDLKFRGRCQMCGWYEQDYEPLR